MELPQKIKQPEERTMHGTLVVTHLSPTELKINELIEYLESQKEGEEPKQIDVEELCDEYSMLDRHVTMCVTLSCGTCRLYVRKMEDIINTFKQALQQ